jgi:hypothetical protein
MLEAANARPRFTISLKRSTQNLQLSTSRRPITPSLPPISDVLLSRSKGAGASKRAKGAMMAPLSDRQRWGINAGASLGHQRRASLGIGKNPGFRRTRDYRRPSIAPRTAARRGP